MIFDKDLWINNEPDLRWIVDSRKYREIYAMNNPALDVDIYRWRDDDGSETAATFLELADTPHDFDVSSGNVQARLRLDLSESGGATAPNETIALEFDINGGGFNALTASSTGCIFYDSSNLTDGDATTEQLNGGGTFDGVSGQVENGVRNGKNLGANNDNEIEFTVEFVAADLSDSDSITFRLNGSTTGVITNTVTATATITKGASNALDAAPALIISLAADLKAAGQLDAAAALTLAVVADLKSRGQLDAAADLAFAITADLKAAGKLDAAAALTLSLVADLSSAPNFGNLVKQAFDFGFTVQTATVDLGSNPTSGNLLIFVFGSDSSVIALTAAPVGFTLLTSSEDGDGTHFWWYKISDGTEQIRSASMDFNSQLQGRYIEYIWDGSTPIVNTNENVDNITTDTNSQPSGALTPTQSNNILLAAHFSQEALNNAADQAIAPGSWIVDNFFETSNTGQGKLSRRVNVTGSQEATHSDTSVGRPMYGSIASFDVPGNAMDASPALILSLAANLTSAGKVDAGVAMVFGVVADLKARGQLEAAAALAFAVSADLRARGQLDAAVAMLFSVAASLSAAGKLDAAAAMIFTVAADLKAVGQLDAAAALVFSLAPDLTAAGDPALDAVIAMAISVIGDLKSTGSLAATPALLMSLTADLRSVGTIAAAPALAFGLSPDLLAPGTLAASSDLAFSLSPDLTAATSNALQASADMAFSIAPALTSRGALLASVLMQFSLVANIVDGAGVSIPNSEQDLIASLLNSFQNLVAGINSEQIL